MLPNVITMVLVANSSTLLVNAAPVQGPGPFTLSTTQLDTQRRILITSSANDATTNFKIVGTNQAGFAISENLLGPNTSTVQSVLDYLTVKSISNTNQTTNGTVSIGTSSTADCLWNIVNTHVSPFELQIGTILQTGAATWSIQYTYDDPNNTFGLFFPAGSTTPQPQPFNHPTIVNQTASVDGSINDPIFAWRLQISGGTGTVRAVGIQAGIAGP
jgi:hypothetical protein